MNAAKILAKRQYIAPIICAGGSVSAPLMVLMVAAVNLAGLAACMQCFVAR